MKILALESWYGGSHKQWLDGLMDASRFDFELLSLSDRHWKWRMQGGSLALAGQFARRKNLNPDLILASSMVDFPLFDSLAKTQHIPKIVYFHENQFAYPISEFDSDLRELRDKHYAFINLKSACLADRLIFNSEYNRSTFLKGVDELLSTLPDYKDFTDCSTLDLKSVVIPLGFSFPTLERKRKKAIQDCPVILWNHRFEFDKNPEDFFKVLLELKKEKLIFKIIILGARSGKVSNEVVNYKEILKEEILHWGHVESKDEYYKWLQQADLLPVTSNQDFFGISIVEAIHAGVHPLLPRRLAYEELIPSDCQGDVFYEGLDDLKTKIRNFPLDSQSTKLINHVHRLSWRNLIRDYEEAFLNIIS